tara:strand:+ start:5557 stop:6174 length:618 start_codon:yes stop_codon:yes gene_type:complete
MALKHIGRLGDTKKKCAVVYRVVPGEPNSAVIVMTESLAAEEHDSLMKLIESPAGQDAYELGESMARATLPDGRIMLSAFHATGKMNKVDSARVEMIPNSSTTVNLQELNRNIAEQQGVSIADLALKGPDGKPVPDQTAPKVDAAAMYTDEVATDDSVLSDEQLASSYRSQADRLFKEAKVLREQAEELVPTKRKKATANATEEG